MPATGQAAGKRGKAIIQLRRYLSTVATDPNHRLKDAAHKPLYDLARQLGVRA